MMATLTDARPTESDTQADGLAHCICPCDEDTAFCGADVTGHPWVDMGGPDDCLVCVDLVEFECPRCGSVAD